jgi:hypothetical protein
MGEGGNANLTKWNIYGKSMVKIEKSAVKDSITLHKQYKQIRGFEQSMNATI